MIAMSANEFELVLKNELGIILYLFEFRVSDETATRREFIIIRLASEIYGYAHLSL